MNTSKPKLNLYCYYTDGTEKDLNLDIDLSYDPLLGKPYIKRWILYIIKKNFECDKTIQKVDICQTNISNCKEFLPYWYYELKQTNDTNKCYNIL